MVPMPLALWKLLGLHFRGLLRRMLAGVRTPRGLTFLLLSLIAIGGWAASALYSRHRHAAYRSAGGARLAPFIMLSFCVGNLIMSVSENAVAFTAAEVDFLFPGPFSRRALLGFKIIKTALGTIATALILSVLLMR